MREIPTIEIREPGRPVRSVSVDRVLEVGRECDGVLLSDDGVSRRHLKLMPSPLGLSVVDLGSRNGTMLNGSPLIARTVLEPGDVLRIGNTDIVVPQVVRAHQPEPAAPSPRQTILASAAVATMPAPPPAPVAVKEPSRVNRTLRWLFTGRGPTASGPLFRTYLELPKWIPVPVWNVVRVFSILGYLALCIAMFIRPAGALFTFFKVIVPLLPILFFVAPGLWRNICPLAAANQTPRVLGFSKAGTAPDWLRRRSYVIALTLFFCIAGARLVLFNTNGAATGTLLLITIANAFLAGVLLKGKSGWCSSICPLLPLQRMYGQTPFVLVGNSHCNPCVACTTNCYDFQPQLAYQADIHDPDPQWSGPRKLFAGALPGFILGFFTLVGAPHQAVLQTVGKLALFVAGSVGTFFAAEAMLGLTIGLLTALYGAAAINSFYWYASVTLAGSFGTITGTHVGWLRWPLRLVVALFAVIWVSRTYWAERRFLAENPPAPQLLSLTAKAKSAPKVAPTSSGDGETADVQFAGGAPVAAEIGLSLLELAEHEGLAIEAGCRMGVCGADPVAVVGGMDCLSTPDEEELNTLRRLGFADTTRMACCARVEGGSVQVSLTPEPGTGGAGGSTTTFDRTITSVVVLGNGIAGVTAADFVRRGHPECEIHLVGQESHVLYNRMGISRLVYGRSAMAGLSLLAEDWYSEHGITAWLNTVASRIDLDAHRVVLGTGEDLFFDRLILATGSSSAVPPLDGFGLPGSFVMRTASDAMQIRSYVQQNHSRHAFVAGGGLLGLEAAHALNELGLQVTVLERGKRLLSRQIDERCSELVQAHFDRLGIRVLYGGESRSLSGTGRLDTLTLADGRILPCDVFLAAVGIRPNADIAKAAGIAVNRGVLVDDRMATSAPGVFAAGDVAEHDSLVLGLWPIAAKQGETAAVNALGGDARLVAEIPATILKGVGLELTSVGKVEPDEGDEVIVHEDASGSSYRRLVVSRGLLVGAIVLGHHPEDLAAATAAVKKRMLIYPSVLAELRAGNWRALKTSGRQTATHKVPVPTG